MADSDSTRIVTTMFDAWNAHDEAQFVALLDPSTVWESDSLPAPLRGIDGARQLYGMWLGAFPDLHLDQEQVIANGEHVLVRWRLTGTHAGEMLGIKATRRTVELHGAVVHQVRNGRHTHAWLYWDNVRLLRQLGAMP